MLLGLPDPVIAAFLAFCRIGGCFMVMPGFSSARLPVRVRLLLVIVLVIPMMTHVWDLVVPGLAREPASMAFLIASETAIGVFIGLVARMYLLALGFIGTAIATSIGLGAIGGVVVEDAEPQAALGAMISLFALIILFTLEFHHEMIRALVASYFVFPVGESLAIRPLLVTFVDKLAEAFVVVLRFGSPFIAYAIIVNLAVGLLNKLTPQIPIYFVSLPFVIAGGLGLFYLAIPSIMSLFGGAYSDFVIVR